MAKDEYRGSFKRLSSLLEEYLAKDPRHTQTSFQTLFGLSNAYFQNRNKKEGRIEDKTLNEPTLEKIHNAQPLLNIEWLKYGEGEPWLEDCTRNEIEPSHISKLGRPYYNIDFLGGFSELFSDEPEVPQDYIYMEPYNKDCYIWCNLNGDSMSPLIQSGAKICLKFLPAGIEDIIYGNVYAIVTANDMRTVKRIIRCEDETKIRLVPENKDTKYGDYQDILKEDVIRVFKVELAVNPL